MGRPRPAAAPDALVSDDAGARDQVETCEACRGYVKTLTVLLPTEPSDIALADFDSLALDLAVLAHGYHRPPGPERLVAEDPDRDELDGWQLTQCLERSEPHDCGRWRSRSCTNGD